jgi:hypothetical protein
LRNTWPYLFSRLFSILTRNGERHIVKGTAHLITEEAENLRLWNFVVILAFRSMWSGCKTWSWEAKEIQWRVAECSRAQQRKKIEGLGLNFVTGGLHFDEFLGWVWRGAWGIC